MAVVGFDCILVHNFTCPLLVYNHICNWLEENQQKVLILFLDIESKLPDIEFEVLDRVPHHLLGLLGIVFINRKGLFNTSTNHSCKAICCFLVFTHLTIVFEKQLAVLFVFTVENTHNVGEA